MVLLKVKLNSFDWNFFAGFGIRFQLNFSTKFPVFGNIQAVWRHVNTLSQWKLWTLKH